ncbi:sigma-70 family RNA polymerase sigma factor [Nonomuraea jiangxiensis]|uniref:RNA polymerase sigma-70 factor, ECF subfamily n=1 Tax=Nonomuraea jiangxiensis TaxID=633440 RepID=A0A1G9MSM6_9ACTN|nr:RNA polymerase sigma-70 factor, ECF subfamily [Nonomuraea jiangxiensis]
MNEPSEPTTGTVEPLAGGGPVDCGTDSVTEVFLAHRNLLFTVAYEMLGSAADAEDVLQETWLRWVKVDRGQVRDQRAYLVRITTRCSLDRLRTIRRRKEDYVGSWLPEPLLTAPDVAEDVEFAESVSMALMLVLETLSPTERAVFVLREVFAISHEEIAAAVGKTPVTVRQIAHRARRHVEARRPREVASRPRPGRCWSRCGARSKPGTCRACLTCSPRRSSWSAMVAASSRPRRGRSSAPAR